MTPERLVDAYIGLGSNLSEPKRQLGSALQALAQLPGTRVRAVSSFYRSAPIGFADQPDFVNAVAWVQTALEPRPLLEHLLEIEMRHGRVRARRDGPRTLDLDLLVHGSAKCDESGLTLPHPRMHERAFVMVPLAEISPDFDVAGHGAARELALQLAATQRVDRFEDA
jgi:2-amino-4-hydroxy-6-hydroxymethyldihydropteridine diphosphokinase